MSITRNHPFIQLCRLDKLTGVWLIMFPCWWGVALTQSPSNMEFYFQLFLFFIGAISMRAAGCIINDLTDRKFDKAVERTRTRPLVAGTATVTQAIVYFGLLCSVGLMVFLCLSPLAQILSLLAFVLLVVYPWMKRITYWPQFVLGLAFNSGILIAFANNMQFLNRTVWLVYGAGILWTLAYDTIYAFQDIEDDLKVGVKSTAILFQKYPKLLPTVSYGGMGLIFMSLGWHWDCLAIFISVTGYLVWSWKPKEPLGSLKIFKRNQIVGWVVFLVLSGCL